MTNEEINKSCYSLITGGEGCWHIYIQAPWHPESDAIIISYDCGCGDGGLWKSDNKNPDYLNNKSDAYDLILFVVNKWEGWGEFLNQYVANYRTRIERTRGQDAILSLFKDQRALPEALARHHSAITELVEARTRIKVVQDIMHELYKAVETLGGKSDILSTLGSYGDTMSDEDILIDLKVWNGACIQCKGLNDSREHLDICESCEVQNKMDELKREHDG